MIFATLVFLTISLPSDFFIRIAAISFTPAHILIAFGLMLIIAFACGYMFRASIGRDLTHFQVAEVVEHLEAYWLTAQSDVKTDVGKLADELKKKLGKI